MRLLQTQREAPSSAGCFFAGAGLRVRYIAERCPYLAGFQDITLADQKDAPNVRPYIYLAGFLRDGSANPAPTLEISVFCYNSFKNMCFSA